MYERSVMSSINGRISTEWIHNNRPYNGLFRAYWTEDGNASVENTGLPVRYEWYCKDGKRADGISRGWWPNGQLKQEMTWKDGELLLEIHWGKNGVKTARYTWKNGKRDGLQTYWYPNGHKRKESTYKDGKQDGVETRWYQNGQKIYEVNYKEGLYYGDNIDSPYSGKVVIYYENGKKEYEGTFKDGKLEGLVTGWHESGQKHYEKPYHDGKTNGLSIEWHTNGRKAYEATWEDGKEEGVVILWKPNGQVERKDIYTDGIRTRPAGIDYEDYLVPGEDEVHHKEYGPNHNPKNGKFRKHWSNGNLRYEWEYKNGKRVDGISRGWWPNGQLKQEWTWKDGRVNGLQTHYWMSGKKSCEGSYKEIPAKLVRVGKWTWWYEKETGEQKYREINYKNDPIETRHGLVTLWYDNGQKKVEGNYKDGKEDGIWIAWDENGQIKRENKNYDDKLFSLNAGYNKIPEEFLLEPLKKYKKRKKKIIFNGCSLTYGAESVHDGIDQHLDNFNNSYPMLIQKKLKNIEVINLASCGKSNSQMFCQNIDYLMESISNEDELIFITQWSWVERFPKVVSVKNINKFEKTAEWLSFLKYYSDQEHGISTIADYDGRHDTWVDADLNMEEHNVQYNLLANMSLTMLLSYINLLDTYNVKNLNYITQLLTTDEMKVSNRFQEGNNDFTSTYDLNCITEEILKHKNFLMDDWITEFICKPKFLRKNSHASAEAHQLWANKLLRILLDKDYIKKEDLV